MSEQKENQTEKKEKKPTAPRIKKVVTPVTESTAPVEEKINKTVEGPTGNQGAYQPSATENTETTKEAVAPIVASAETVENVTNNIAEELPKAENIESAKDETEGIVSKKSIEEVDEEIKKSNKNVEKTDSFDASLGEAALEAEVIEEGPVAEEHVFEKPLPASEKAHYETILKSNKKTISSLRKQVMDLRTENEKFKSTKE